MVGDGLANARSSTRAHARVERRTLRVAGIYHTGIFFEDTGAIIDLATAQQLEHRRNEATTIAVQLRPSRAADTAEQSIKDEFTGIAVIGTPDEAGAARAQRRAGAKAVTIIATLALIVGGLGVTNTMAMAVMERERELALLNAVGWRRRGSRRSSSPRGWRRASRRRASGCCSGSSARRPQPCARRLLGRLAACDALDHRPGAPDRGRDRRAGRPLSRLAGHDGGTDPAVAGRRRRRAAPSGSERPSRPSRRWSARSARSPTTSS